MFANAAALDSARAKKRALENDVELLEPRVSVCEINISRCFNEIHFCQDVQIHLCLDVLMTFDSQCSFASSQSQQQSKKQNPQAPQCAKCAQTIAATVFKRCSQQQCKGCCVSSGQLCSYPVHKPVPSAEALKCKTCERIISNTVSQQCSGQQCKECCVGSGKACKYPAHKNAAAAPLSGTPKCSTCDSTISTTASQQCTRQQCKDCCTGSGEACKYPAHSNAAAAGRAELKCSNAACEGRLPYAAFLKCSQRLCSTCCEASGQRCGYAPHANASARKAHAHAVVAELAATNAALLTEAATRLQTLKARAAAATAREQQREDDEHAAEHQREAIAATARSILQRDAALIRQAEEEAAAAAAEEAARNRPADLARWGLHAAWWDRVEGLLDQWRANNLLSFGEMRCCGFCGAVELGGRRQHAFTAVEPTPGSQGFPPYAFTNMRMCDKTLAPDGKWWQCSTCSTAAGRSQRLKWASEMLPDYQDMVLQPGLRCLAVQNLALLDCRVRMPEFSVLHEQHKCLALCIMTCCTSEMCDDVCAHGVHMCLISCPDGLCFIIAHRCA